MSIDTSLPRTPGWWLARLSSQLRLKQVELEKLDQYYRGDPPLPQGAENARSAYAAFQRKARTNFAELIVDSMVDRMTVRAVRTALDDDDDGDALAWAVWRRNRMPIHFTDVLQWMLELGDGYAIVGDLDDDPTNPLPVVTAEDPRQVITEHDPVREWVTRAGVKLFHDEAAGQDVAYLYLAGSEVDETFVAQGRARVFRAVRVRRTTGARPGSVRFSAGSWDWDEVAGGQDGRELGHHLAPVVRFRNRNGRGEFASHTDLLDRINHMILQRMVIVTFQAFRQRAIKGLPDVYPPEHPRAGEEIDYDELFSADPGALWKLPLDAEMWESAQADITSVLTGTRDDVQHLASVTRTPLHYFTPDAAAGSAEGASLQREGHVFKIEDRNGRAGDSLALLFSLVFLTLGDTARASADAITVDWVPAERFSLAEQANAAVQAKAADVPWRTRGARIWQFSPDELKRQESERADDAALAQLAAPPTPAHG